MSEQLIQVFLGDTPIHLDDAQADVETPLLWKVVLRTGTWKLRPGPGGVKIKAPLKIFRDKAPKGHISMAALKTNFDAGAKEHVTVPSVHADGTTSDGGFVKKLVIQDVPGEDGSGVKESLLWAGMEITDSELSRKLSEKSIRGVSGGILFDYERTEDAKKFDQILSHVMVTNSPWINGTGDFHDKLPEGVMASEAADLPMGEVEFESRETEAQVEPELPAVSLADPPAPPEAGAATTQVVWKPEQGLGYARAKVKKALEEWRRATLASLSEKQRYTADWPYFSVEDVSLEADGGTALIGSGYGSDKDTWVAGFKFDKDRDVEIDPFAKWTPAKQEWVAASEDQPAPTPPPARPAGRIHLPVGRLSGLQEAQAARRARSGLGTVPSPTSGGSMGLSDLFSGVELSDEQREALRAEEARIARFEQAEKDRIERERQAEVTAYCGEGGKLDEIGLGDPGVKKYVRNALLSDDGGPAIELSEHLDGGQKTNGVPRTATDLLKGFIDSLPKQDGKVTLSEQARRLPDDPKPPAEHADKPKDPKSEADALLAEFGEQGLGHELVMTKEA
jgi:hypothetical protein